MQTPRRALPAAVSALAAVALVASPAVAAKPVPVDPTPDPDTPRSAYHLSGWAALPAETFVPGSEESGKYTGNPDAPFPGQPVQGFSAVHAVGDGSYLVMSDNGFGAKTNSQDAQLRVHHIRPDLATGEVEVLDDMGFVLSDPDGHVDWKIWREDRILTGWDFDLESMQIAKDGTFWFGEEFGPYLLHTDAQGRLLEAPIATPGVQSPQNPELEGEPNLAQSKGFEGMAISPNSQWLYPMLEGATAEDKAAGLAADLRIYDVRLRPRKSASFTGDFRRYRMESPSHALGDFIMINTHQALVIERDNLDGAEAEFKRIYLVDLRDRDRDGYVDKQLLVDLMDVPNPLGLGNGQDPFTFPYFTIEDVEILDADTIAVLNDNNFPATGGRGDDVRDVNEFLTIDLDEPLKVDHGCCRACREPYAVRLSRSGCRRGFRSAR